MWPGYFWGCQAEEKQGAYFGGLTQGYKVWDRHFSGITLILFPSKYDDCLLAHLIKQGINFPLGQGKSSCSFLFFPFSHSSIIILEILVVAFKYT